MPWDPDRYHRFQAERFQPFEDLLRLVPRRAGVTAVDLGCGTGELTARLAEALPDSTVIGVDSSPEMLARAQPLTRPGLRFVLGDLAAVEGQYDLVFSHAALQWVDDHHALIPRLFGILRPGGRLAVQIPANQLSPAHLALEETAAEEPFRAALGGWTRAWPILTLEQYATLLFTLGGSELTALAKVYPHVLDDADAVVDWMAGTAAVPYRDRLSAALFEDFMARYREKLRLLMPGSPVFYPFRRILFAATRPAVPA